MAALTDYVRCILTLAHGGLAYVALLGGAVLDVMGYLLLVVRAVYVTMCIVVAAIVQLGGRGVEAGGDGIDQAGPYEVLLLHL